MKYADADHLKIREVGLNALDNPHSWNSKQHYNFTQWGQLYVSQWNVEAELCQIWSHIITNIPSLRTPL